MHTKAPLERPYLKMTDSGSFTSLLALVDSHLSKTKIQESRSEDASNVCNRFPIPDLTSRQPGTLSDTRLALPPGQRLPIPSFKPSDSSIQDVLAEQVANMLKAKELKKQQEEEKQKLAEKMIEMKLEEPEDCVIDLLQALQTPWEPRLPEKENVLSSCSSIESLFEPKFIDCDNVEAFSPEPLLPCKTDMSYILAQKVRKGKGSAFGKVLSSRLRPVAYPYLRENIETSVVPFDFSTPSPCDLIKEKLRKPTTSCCAYTPDIFSIF